VISGRRLLLAARNLLLGTAYLILLLAVALGSAGIIALWSHPPGTSVRAELTWQGDARLVSLLADSQRELAAIGAEVDRMSVLARGAIASLAATDEGQLAVALAEGTSLAGAIEADSMTLRAGLTALPGANAADAIVYGGEVLARRGAMLVALDATEGLGRSWASLTAGSLQAAELLVLLGEHDTTVAAAAGQGRAASYDEALATLGTALARLDDAVKIRDQLSNTADVSTLDAWIARNRRYDDALSALYVALRASAGQIDDAVRAAYREEGEARAQLPPDTRGLIVILADMGRAGLNQAVIAIEQARGRLNLALEELTSSAGPGPGRFGA